ncbi:isochorismatase family protein [Aliivibrio sp. S2TY2]|uniref:Isochorismatase hydrolase n=1 Tax=Aliivibrio fischeri (strain MJ11) TaxID=388396 RepID=B5EUB0_ALIFM|nr:MULTISPECIES: isochorismatase family protein [Aliivibrio]ACH64618.1 isochorismatase hydrolase [Aliivibrio fischeri MJ11]MDD9177036.1 isochorismatase family protein [Aliivibrio sp. S3TY1]MDD9194125.1 isochorismatase family protein [Aliivibrio sp. S2TY2]
MKSAVLVIDVQSALFDPEPKPFESDIVVKKINKVTHWARNNSLPVIFIQHEQLNSILEFECDGWQLQSGLELEVTDIKVRKTTPDSFLNTELKVVLNAHQIEHLIICGYASEFCIDTTVRRAAGLGYSIELVSDAHTTHDKPHASGNEIRMHHNCTLPNISSFGVKITATPTDALI